MASEENKVVVRRYVEGVYQSNLDLFEEIFAPDFAQYGSEMIRCPASGT